MIEFPIPKDLQPAVEGQKHIMLAIMAGVPVEVSESGGETRLKVFTENTAEAKRRIDNLIEDLATQP